MRASARVMQENVPIVSAMVQPKKTYQSQTRFPFFAECALRTRPTIAKSPRTAKRAQRRPCRSRRDSKADVRLVALAQSSYHQGQPYPKKGGNGKNGAGA
jgi:hypothetical protein